MSAMQCSSVCQCKINRKSVQVVTNAKWTEKVFKVSLNAKWIDKSMQVERLLKLNCK